MSGEFGKLIIIAGPTAIGKSGLSVRLAKEIGGEVISADSMQVYRGMDIGTAKITEAEMQGVPHHLIDILDINEEFNAAVFQHYAKEACRMLVEVYDGRLPDNMEELLTLPGVGRKVANLLLGDVYHTGGFVTDTHCIRICGRIGFYPESEKNPAKIEKLLDPLLPRAEQSDYCHRIVQFGRDVCTARAPQCDICPLAEFCEHRKG